jgi:acetyltransferase
MVNVRQVQGSEAELLDGLCRLLIDCTDGGGSVGFLAPLQPATARRYWEGVYAALSSAGSGQVLWVAEANGEVVGSVQLSLCQKENGLHRGEVQKLFVLSPFRGRGIAAKLMAELESFARGAGRTLLVLDTEAGSRAEGLYEHLGWRRLGEIPGYARSPNGVLRATAYHFKTL